MKLLKIALVGTMVLGLSSSALFADAAKGQKIFSAKLKDPCE